MAKQEKARFKLGQKVWYIADGYIAVGFVQGIFYSKHGNILVSTQTTQYNAECEKWCVSDCALKDQDSYYTTKEDLVKYVKEIEDDTLED